MAQTQKFYRLGQRRPRQTTKLNSFANGMYLTKQTIPEGYVKAMVNYDIDDTGSHIKPRFGRKKIQEIDFPVDYENNKHTFITPATVTDFIYVYNKEQKEVEDTLDVVFGLGRYTKNTGPFLTNGNYEDVVAEKLGSVYVAAVNETVDSNVYELVDGDYVITEPGEINNYKNDFLWGTLYNKKDERFEYITNEDIGYITARTIEHAYAFDKQVGYHAESEQEKIDIKNISLPIYTIMSNELYAFSGPVIEAQSYTYNPERDELVNAGTPSMSKLIVVHEDDGYKFIRKAIEPYTPSIKQSTTQGYNMLKEYPFVAEDTAGGALAITGVEKYRPDERTRPVFGPTVGKPMDMRVYYQYPSGIGNIKMKVEELDLTVSNSEYTVLSDFGNAITPGSELWYSWTPTKERMNLRFTIREGDNTATENTYTFTCNCHTVLNDEAEKINFDLSTCKGLFSWYSMLGVYGVQDADDTIFLSDVENPSYFPYPQNTITFDNKILYIHNYLDYLLVITVDSVWLLELNTAGFVQKRILANIFIPEIDAVNSVVLKDQIFFKTNDQFYVLKPNQYTSDATDLKNYINSTAISNYILDFTNETVNLLNEVYRLTYQRLCKEYRDDTYRFTDFNVVNIRSIIKDSEVHYLYNIIPELTNKDRTNVFNVQTLVLHLVYNTISRSWRLYFRPYGHYATNAFSPILYRNKQSGVHYEFITSGFNPNRLIVIEHTYDTVSDDIILEQDEYHTEYLLKGGYWGGTEPEAWFENYPYIDTGTIAVEDINTKRYREVQFNLVNLEKETIRFYSDFKLDGKEWIHATHYEVTQGSTVPIYEDYGIIYITPIEYTNMNLYGLTTLADEVTEEDYWAIDLSRFPEHYVVSVRFELQGRGRRASLQLLNTSLKKYQLSDINWVYRTMSAR